MINADHEPDRYTQAELIEIAKEMHACASCVYWFFFKTGMGSKAHAYIEFCGLLNKYVEICSRAACLGVDFTVANVHSRTPLPVEVHDMQYLGEKLQCIFGPMIAANPEARAALKQALFGDEP